MAVPVYVGDRVLVSTDTTGTGTYDLGTAVSGYLTPANAGVTTGVRVAYVVVDSLTNPSTFEVGEGTYTAGSPATISRTLIVRNSSGGTSAVSWSAGTKYLFLAPSASRFVMYDSDGGFSLNTHLTLVSGAASSVAVSTPGDRNTGLFFPGPDRVALVTNGSTRLEFNATGAALFNDSHGTSGQVLRTNGSTTAPTWVSVFDLGAVNKAGDTLTGPLYASGTAGVYGSAGTSRVVQWATGATTRWQAITDNATESGSNVGSNFALRAFSDAGVSLGDVFEVTRSTRKLDFKVTPSVNGSNILTNADISTTYGGVGSYGSFRYPAGAPSISLGGTTAGSNLSPSVSGTWRYMGAGSDLGGNIPGEFGNNNILFLRIS